MTASWTVERTGNPRLPYRIAIEQGGRLVLAFRAQARWPGPGQQIFCLRERELDPAEPLEIVERVPIAQVATIGRKVSVVLDRPSRKRCEFLTVRKPRRDGSGSYEQTFFRTESGIRAHRSGGRVELRTEPDRLQVAIDSGERYPWRFPGATVERRKLAAGDYALLDRGQPVALVERKSFDNLLGEVGSIQAFHHQLADLAGHPAAVLVIEAEYRDFLNPGKVRGRWPVSHLARVLAEMSALHPTLPVIFAGNRTAANGWTCRYFRAIAGQREAGSPQLVLDVARAWDPLPRAAGTDDRIRAAATHGLPSSFGLRELQAAVPGVALPRLRRVLAQLGREGRLVKMGRGDKARWERRRAPPSLTGPP